MTQVHDDPRVLLVQVVLDAEGQFVCLLGISSRPVFHVVVLPENFGASSHPLLPELLSPATVGSALSGLIPMSLASWLPDTICEGKEKTITKLRNKLWDILQQG